MLANDRAPGTAFAVLDANSSDGLSDQSEADQSDRSETDQSGEGGDRMDSGESEESEDDLPQDMIDEKHMERLDPDVPGEPDVLANFEDARQFLSKLQSMEPADFLRFALIAAPMLAGVYAWKVDDKATNEGFFEYVRRAFVIKLAYENRPKLDYVVQLGVETTLVEIVVAIMYRCIASRDQEVALVCNVTGPSTHAKFCRSKLAKAKACKYSAEAARLTLIDMNSIDVQQDRLIFLNRAKHFPKIIHSPEKFPNPRPIYLNFWALFKIPLFPANIACVGAPGADLDDSADPGPLSPEQQYDLACAMVKLLACPLMVFPVDVRPAPPVSEIKQ